MKDFRGPYGLEGWLPTIQSGGENFTSLSGEELVPAAHKARIISDVVDKMDLSVLYSSYCTDNGQNGYDPWDADQGSFFSTFVGIFSSR